jgi:hypothetical protein
MIVSSHCDLVALAGSATRPRTFRYCAGSVLLQLVMAGVLFSLSSTNMARGLEPSPVEARIQAQIPALEAYIASWAPTCGRSAWDETGLREEYDRGAAGPEVDFCLVHVSPVASWTRELR